MDFEAATGLAWRVFELTPSVPGRLTDPRVIFLRDFPRGSCDSLAYATGMMLWERGLGDWWLVVNRNDESRHVWLEWRDDDGDILFSIDTTAHQFPLIDRPFVGHGETPTRAMFPEEISAVRISEISPTWPRDSDERLLEHVQLQIRGHAGDG